MSLGLGCCFLEKKSGGPGRIVLGGRGRFVAGQREAGHFEEGLPNGCAAEVGESVSAKPASHQREFIDVAITKEGGQKFDFLQSRARLGEGMEKFAEVSQIAGRTGERWREDLGFGIFFEKLKLVIAVNRPGFVSPRTEIGGKLPRASVKSVNQRGSHFLHGIKKARVVGMIGEGEHAVDLVAVLRTRSERPATEHGGASFLVIADQTGSDGRWRRDDRVAVRDGFFQKNGRGEVESEIAAGFGHLVNRLLHRSGDARLMKNSQRFLSFPERVGEEDRGLVVRESLSGEGDDVLFDFIRGRENKAGKTKGGFHDEDIGLGKLRCLGGMGRTGFEIAGVEERLVVLFNPDHRRARDMPGGVEGDAVLVENELFVPVEGFDGRGFDAVSFDEDVAGARRAKDPLVAGEVIGVPV